MKRRTSEPTTDEAIAVEERDLAILVNASANLGSCAICGVDSDPGQLGGFEIFLREPLTWVCHDCGHDYAPNLAQLLDLADAATQFTWDTFGSHPPQPDVEDLDDEDGPVH